MNVDKCITLPNMSSKLEALVFAAWGGNPVKKHSGTRLLSATGRTGFSFPPVP